MKNIRFSALIAAESPKRETRRGRKHIAAGNNLFVGGGDTNIINSAFGPVLLSSIVGGSFNTISDDGVGTTSDLSFIGGGEIHQMGGQCSFIGGGSGNIIFSAAGLGPVNLSTIGGGTANVISDDGVKTAAEAFIGGGTGNQVHGRASSVVGGDSNYVWGKHAIIGGGELNLSDVGTPHSFIGGGCSNGVFSGSACSFISGGQDNHVGSGGGNGALWSGIGGGQANFIDDTAAPVNHSSIFSGNGNTVSGSCSSILGGDNNNDNGNPWTGIYGTGINASAIPSGTGAFWANELVIPNIPAGVGGLPPAGYPLGSLYWLPAGPLKQVYVV